MTYENPSLNPNIDYRQAVWSANNDTRHLRDHEGDVVLGHAHTVVNPKDQDAVAALMDEVRIDLNYGVLNPEQAKWFAIGAATQAAALRHAHSEDDVQQGARFRSS